MPIHLIRGQHGYRERALHFELRRWRFVFGSSKLPQIELVVENIAEVDAAGRYIPFPLVCWWLTMPSRTPLGMYYIYQRRGYHSVCLQLRLWKASNCKTGRNQIPRFSYVVNQNRKSVRFWVFGGHILNAMSKIKQAIKPVYYAIRSTYLYRFLNLIQNFFFRHNNLLWALFIAKLKGNQIVLGKNIVFRYCKFEIHGTGNYISIKDNCKLSGLRIYMNSGKID